MLQREHKVHGFYEPSFKKILLKSLWNLPICLLFSIITFNATCMAQSHKVSKPMNEGVSIDEMIKIVKDHRQKEILSKFRQTLDNEDSTLVEEYEDHYEIQVIHPPKGNYSGGAERYSLDKKTGNTRIIWHEHPVRIPLRGTVEMVTEDDLEQSEK